MPNVTENAIIPLRPGVDLESPDSPDAQAWRKTLAILAEQPGCVRLATGMQVENPDVLQMLIEWTSVQDHTNFMAAPAYEPFFNNIKGIMSPTAAPILTHHNLSSSTSALTGSSPVTELVSFYFDPSFDESSFAGPVQVFADAATQHAQGLRGAAHGWSVEKDVEHASLADVSGGKGKVWLLVVGWDSIDAHMAYRQTDAFRQTIGGLRQKASGVEMHHVIFKEYQG